MYNHKKLYLIAEVGGNHNGNFSIAKKTINHTNKMASFDQFLSKKGPFSNFAEKN